MKLTSTQHAQHGYTITEFKSVGGGTIYGVVWYDTGEHITGASTPEEVEQYAERLCNYHEIRNFKSNEGK